MSHKKNKAPQTGTPVNGTAAPANNGTAGK